MTRGAGKTVQGRFKTSGTDRMEKQLRGIEGQLKDLGKAGKNLADGLSKASVGVGVAVAGFYAIGQAASVAADATRELVEAMVALSARGGDVISFAAAFERVGGSRETIQRLREASGHYVRDADLMRQYTQAIDGGVMSGQEYIRGLGLIEEAARDAGQNVQEMTNAFSLGASGSGVRFLAKLGINVRALQADLMGTGVAAASFEGQAITLRRALEQLDERYGESSNAASHTQDAVELITAAFQNMFDEVSAAFAGNEELKLSLVAMASTLRDTIPHAAALGNAIAHVAVEMLSIAEQAAPFFINVLRRMIDAIQDTIALMLSTPMGRMGIRELYGIDPESLAELSRDLDGVDRAVWGIGQAFEGLAESARNATSAMAGAWDVRIPLDPNAPGFWNMEVPEMLARQPGDGRRRGGRAGRGAARETESTVDRLMGEDVAAGGLFDEVIQHQTTLEEELHAARLERLEELKTSETELFEKRLEEGARLKEEEMAIAEAMAEKQVSAYDAWFAQQSARWEVVKGVTDKVGGQIQGIASAMQTMSGMFGQLASNKLRDLENTRQAMREMGKSEAEISAATKDREKSVKRLQKAEGAFLVAYNIAMAAVEVAKAIGSYPDVGGIIAHAAAAAAHGVAAGIAASKLGGGGGGGGAATSVPTVETFTPSDNRGVEVDDAPQPSTTNVVNYYSVERSNESLGKALREADYQYERSDGRAVGGLGVSYS